MFGATSRMMTEVCGGTSHVIMKVYDATSHMMMEVGGEASRMMKVDYIYSLISITIKIKITFYFW